MNIFVVLPGNAQWSFLMGTTACQGEKLPLPPHLLCWDTGSHAKNEEMAPATRLGGKLGRPNSALHRGSRSRCCLLLWAAGISPQAPSLPCSQLHLRGDFRVGRAQIWGTDRLESSVGQGVQCRQSCCQPPSHPWRGQQGHTEAVWHCQQPHGQPGSQITGKREYPVQECKL